MSHLKNEEKLHYILRIASAMCFIGHGAFGIITKETWTNYFGVFSIGKELAYHLMPLVGTADLILGIVLLIYPVRAILLWLVIWGAFTALLRPLSGEPFAEFVERSGNFGAPLALLFLSAGGDGSIKNWFLRIHVSARIDRKITQRLTICLRIVIFMLLVGHGWLNVLEKESLTKQYAQLGFLNPVRVAQLTGITEMFFACMVLIRPVHQLVFVLFIWKMISELFYPQHELFEWIERGGSYGTILSLWVLLKEKHSTKRFFKSLICMQRKRIAS